MTVLIDWKEVKKRIPYSRQHWRRLCDEGKAPRAIRIGHHRIAWEEQAVEAWIQDRIRETDEQTP